MRSRIALAVSLALLLSCSHSSEIVEVPRFEDPILVMSRLLDGFCESVLSPISPEDGQIKVIGSTDDLDLFALHSLVAPEIANQDLLTIAEVDDLRSEELRNALELPELPTGYNGFCKNLTRTTESGLRENDLVLSVTAVIVNPYETASRECGSFFQLYHVGAYGGGDWYWVGTGCTDAETGEVVVRRLPIYD